MTANHQTFLAVKALEREDGRWIEGWATTGREDRVGDIVVPEGATYALPLPLLFAHKHDEPIGSVVRAEVTKAGIRIRAKLTEGVARAEEVWKLLQDGALTAVSIGFKALKHSALPSGGLRFDKWEWHELSVVSVPANPDARISVAKCVALTTRTAPHPPKSVLIKKQDFDMDLLAEGTMNLVKEGVSQPNAFSMALCFALIRSVNKHLASRDDKLQEQASRIAALERQLGVTHD